MTKKGRPSRDEMREAMRQNANATRDTANQMALTFDGCDDPLYPYGPQEFIDWRDFVERVARPLVEAEDDHTAEQEAMRLFRKVSPYYLCTALVMAANQLDARC